MYNHSRQETKKSKKVGAAVLKQARTIFEPLVERFENGRVAKMKNDLRLAEENLNQLSSC